MIRPPELSGASPLTELVDAFQAIVQAGPLLRVIDPAFGYYGGANWIADLSMMLQHPGIMGISTPWVRHTAYAVIQAQKYLKDLNIAEPGTRAKAAIQVLNGHCACDVIRTKCVEWIQTNYHVQ